MIKIIEVRIRGQAELIKPECPACNKINKYVVNPERKFTAVRYCYECGAILEILLEEINEKTKAS